MKTTKIISTISYNTESFLIEKLEKDIENEIIDFYIFIKHKGELNEATGEQEKDHIHLFIRPSSSIDKIAYRKTFQELDLTKPTEKPLGVQPFQPTKFYDWYWYGLHDKEYLMIKHLRRQYHYKHSDMITNDKDFLGELVSQEQRPMSLITETCNSIDNKENTMQQAITTSRNFKELSQTFNGVSIVRGLLASQGVEFVDSDKYQTLKEQQKNDTWEASAIQEEETSESFFDELMKWNITIWL